ncbi:AAA family ATPase [Actinophytocola sp.]|uniref:AAA family ATPase n=1 Tax=Actinophytocola sp. TaxID=1872138 RepID=UPI003D6B917D
MPKFKRYLKAPERDNERPPIVVVYGPQGIGKTTLLRQLEEKLGQRTPRALVECERYRKDDIPKLLSDIKRQLGRYCPAIGRLRFRRLEIGLVAIRSQSSNDGSSRLVQRRLVDSIIREFYVHPRNAGDAFGRPADAIMDGARTLPELFQTLLGWLIVTASRLLSRRLLLWLLRRPMKWWGHRDQQLHDKAVDVLEGLSNGSRDKWLIEALLADVRAAFNRGRLAKPGWYNVVVLLDNADTEVGDALLGHLRSLRNELQIANVAAEPFLVVVTRRTKRHGDFLEQHRIPEFTEPEIEWLTKDLPNNVDHRFTKILHQFTSGYPATASAITTAAIHHPEAVVAGLDTLLAVHLDDDGKTVEQQELDKLRNILPRLNGRQLDELATCAVARTQQDADWLARTHIGSTHIDPQFLSETGLWNEFDQAGAHKVLRRLLLRRLGKRSVEPPDLDWPTVCRLLSDMHRERINLADELYYSLAHGDFDAVVHRLAVHLSAHDLEMPWLELLQFVTTAPRQSQHNARDTRSPYDRQVDLAGAVVDDGVLHLRQTARLVAGLWLANDPSTPPNRRELHEQIVADYKQIASDADRPMDLQNEAERHKALAHDWS